MTSEYPVVVVTGAAAGIGAAVARRMAEDGRALVLADLSGEAMNQVASECRRLGSETLSVHMDVTDESGWKRLVAATSEHFGRIDGLVNNAGIAGPLARISDYPADDFRRVLDINVVGSFLGIKYCSGVIASGGRGGSIVNVASISGSHGLPRISGYAASKHALLGLTRCAALELIGAGIRVNAVCPSPVETAMLEELGLSRSPEDPERTRRDMSKSNPMGRVSAPEEIAAVISFLFSEAASYVAGVALPVDGGLAAR